MKLIKLITLSVCLAVSVNLTAQTIDTVDIYYDYELVPTGEVLGQTDTIYNVAIVLDSIDMMQFKQITIEDEKEKKDLIFSAESPSNNKHIVKNKEKFKIDMKQWNGQGRFNVMAKRQDGTVVTLKHTSEKQKDRHKVLTLNPKTRDLTFSKGVPIIEPETNQPETSTENSKQ